MRYEAVLEAVAEAERFRKTARKYEQSYKKAEREGRVGYFVQGSREAAAVKRASLDLTRALADMRTGR